MASKLLADLILILHLAFILSVIFGGLLVMWKPGLAWIHIPLFLWAGMVNMASWICPLTPLEVMYRIRAGQEGYEESFIEHYLEPVVYPAGMTREIEFLTGLAVVLLNVCLYSIMIVRRRRKIVDRKANT
jgi:hypothetical protein